MKVLKEVGKKCFYLLAVLVGGAGVYGAHRPSPQNRDISDEDYVLNLSGKKQE